MSRRDAIALAAIIAVFAVVCAAVGPFHPDRSFVAYRYAENLRAGYGWVYNAGDAPVEGTGNALWVAVCAAFEAAGLSLPAAAPMLSFFFGVASLALLWLALRPRVSRSAAVAATGVAAVSGPLAVASMAGEGVTLMAALAIATVWLLDRAGANRVHWVLAGISGAMLGMCGNALGVVFPAAVAIRVRHTRGETANRAGVILAGAVYLAGVVSFHAWRLATFGSLTSHAPGFGAGLASPADLFVSQPFDMAPFGLLYLALFVAGFAGLVVSREGPGDRLAVGVALVAGAVTLSARDPLPGLAGSAALIPLLLIPAAGLFDAVPRAVRSRAVDAAMIAALMLASLGWAADMRVFARHIRDTHDITLRPLGEWMADWRPGGTMLCALPGALPYYSGWRTRLIVRDASIAESPDLVLLTSEGMFDAVTDETQARIGAALSGRYRLMAALRLDWTRDRAVVMHARNDLPELSDAQRATFPNGLGSVTRLNR